MGRGNAFLGNANHVVLATGIDQQKRLARERFTVAYMSEEQVMIGTLASLFRKKRGMYETEIISIMDKIGSLYSRLYTTFAIRRCTEGMVRRHKVRCKRWDILP